jgi:hypothetical protein
VTSTATSDVAVLQGRQSRMRQQSPACPCTDYGAFIGPYVREALKWPVSHRHALSTPAPNFLTAASAGTRIIPNISKIVAAADLSGC